MEFLEKLKIQLPNDSEISLLGIYTKKTNTVICIYINVHTYNCQGMEATCVHQQMHG